MDPYLALISGTPTEQEKQQQLAKGLRRDADFGALGMVSGDAALSPFGKSLMTRSQGQAVKLGENRVGAEKQRALQGYYDAMKSQMEGNIENQKSRLTLDEQKAKDTAEYQRIMGMAAMIRALNSGRSGSGSDTKKLRSSDIKSLSSQGQIVEVLNGLVSEMENEDFDPGRQGLPLVRSLNNFLARYGIGSQESKDIQDWWATYDKFYTLPERNEKFGATLTVPEKQAWAAANISPEMDRDQIEKKLSMLSSIMTNWAHRQAGGYVTEGYNPDSVYDFLGLEPPEEEGPQTLNAPVGGYGGLYDDDASGDVLPPGITIKVK